MLATAIAAALPIGAVSTTAREAATAAAADTTTMQWWGLFSSLSARDKLRYAALLRETDPGFNELAHRIEDYVHNWEKEELGDQA